MSIKLLSTGGHIIMNCFTRQYETNIDSVNESIYIRAIAHAQALSLGLGVVEQMKCRRCAFLFMTILVRDD